MSLSKLYNPQTPPPPHLLSLFNSESTFSNTSWPHILLVETIIPHYLTICKNKAINHHHVSSLQIYRTWRVPTSKSSCCRLKKAYTSAGIGEQ